MVRRAICKKKTEEREGIEHGKWDFLQVQHMW